MFSVKWESIYILDKEFKESVEKGSEIKEQIEEERLQTETLLELAEEGGICH